MRRRRAAITGVIAALATIALNAPAPAVAAPTFGAALSECHWSNGHLLGNLFAWITGGQPQTEYDYSIWSDFAKVWVPQGSLGTTDSQGFLSRLLVSDLPEQSLPWLMQASGGGTILPDVTVTWTCIPQQADPTPPTITLDSPTDGATFTRDAIAMVHYSCADPGAGASGIATCSGPVGDGALLDTSRLGPQQFTVQATDLAGNQTRVTHQYTVVPAPTPAPPVQPVQPQPTPTVALTPAPTVASVGPPPPLRITISYDFKTHSLGSSWVRVDRLLLSRVPLGATVTLMCRGGCPKRTQQLRGTPRMDLTRRLGRLRPPATIEIRVTQQGAIGYVLRLHVPPRGDIRSAILCLPLGSNLPRSRC